MSQNRLSQTPTEKVVSVVNELGLRKAARRLGTSEASLCRWLKAQQYTRRSVYVKVSKTA